MATLNKFIVGILFVYVLILVIHQPAQISQKDITLDEDDVNIEAILLAEAEPTLSLNDAKTIVGQAYASAKSLKSNTIQWLSCSDSDNGKDFNEAGKVKVGYSYNKRKYTKEYSDKCQDNENLLEYYCRDKRYSSTSTKCDYGCDNGACKQAPSDQDFFARGLSLSGKGFENFLKDYQKPEAKGYIIEFKEKPLAELKVDEEKNLGVSYLKDKLKKIEQYKVEISPEVRPLEVQTIKSEIESKEKEIHLKLLEHERKIKNLHERAKEDILGIVTPIYGSEKVVVTTAKDERILGEFSKVFSGIALDISEEDISKVTQLPYVKSVSPNLLVEALLMDSVPLIGADKVWQLDSEGNNCIESGKECLTGKGVTIAILDTGIDYTHPDLGNCATAQFLNKQCGKVIDGYDFINNDDDPMDDHGHGTHVSAIAAGKADYDNDNIQDTGELWGVAPDAELIAYKVLDNKGSGSFAYVISAIDKVVDPNQDGDFSDHYDIISMSLGADCGGIMWGGCSPLDPQSTAVNNAVEAGVVVVVSASNSGPRYNSIGSPGTARKAITVGATYKKDYEEFGEDISPRVDQITFFSSRGPVYFNGGNVLLKPDVVAPGAIICSARYDQVGRSTCVDDKHISISGTSMAAPHVSGTVALLLEKHPDWSPEEIKASLKLTAVDLGYPMYIQGTGRIDAVKLLSLNEPINPPIVEIVNPSPGSIFKQKQNEVIISGSATGIDFSQYTLFYSKADNLENWIVINNSTNEIVNDVLGTWNISELTDGTYNLRLVVKTNAGLSEEFIQVAIYRNKYEKITPSNAVPRWDVDIYENKIVWSDYRNSELFSFNGDIYFYDLDSKEERRVSKDSIERGKSLPKIYDDKVVWEDTRNIEDVFQEDIYLYDLTLEQEKPIATGPSRQILPTVYGNYVVWADYRSGNFDVYLYDLANDEEKQITSTTENEFPFIYGSDAILWRHLSSYNIYLYNISKQEVEQLIQFPGLRGLDISDRHIVWVKAYQVWGTSEIRVELHIYNISSGEDRIIKTGRGIHYPKIFGNYIIWSDFLTNGGYNDLYLHNIETNTTQQISSFFTLIYGLAIHGNRIVWIGYNLTDTDLGDLISGNYKTDLYVYNIPIDTIPEPQLLVDIKANSLDGPVTVPYNTGVTLSWTSSNAVSCTGFNGYDINNDGFVNIHDISLYRELNPGKTPDNDMFFKELVDSFGTDAKDDGWKGPKLTSGSKSTNKLTESKNYGIFCINSVGKYAYDVVKIIVKP